MSKKKRICYSTIDLCAGIGGIRRGFELTKRVKNVESAEIDPFACKTYKHLFGNDPYNDIMSGDFKNKISQIQYDILLAGFPCQTFSRVGLQEGFDNEEKGKIFFHIAKIVEITRPKAIFLENVDRLITHDASRTFHTILNILINDLDYHVVGVNADGDGNFKFNGYDFIRNSKDFGIPQNRPRTYIICFDKKYFKEAIAQLPDKLPEKSNKCIYSDLNELIEHNVDDKYYMASGYWKTLIAHRKRQEEKGYGFGYRIVNLPDNAKPIANTILATGGSGKERNLLLDPKDGIANKVVPHKRTPINEDGIRVMTPVEWGKLQGFINYAFKDRNGVDHFSFPEGISDGQKYKQFGNSVTIPVIEVLAKFVIDCLDEMLD